MLADFGCGTWFTFTAVQSLELIRRSGKLQAAELAEDSEMPEEDVLDQMLAKRRAEIRKVTVQPLTGRQCSLIHACCRMIAPLLWTCDQWHQPPVLGCNHACTESSFLSALCSQTEHLEAQVLTALTWVLQAHRRAAELDAQAAALNQEIEQHSECHLRCLC